MTLETSTYMIFPVQEYEKEEIFLTFVIFRVLIM